MHTFHVIVLLQSVVDIFGGKDDMASVYVRLHDNKLFLSDYQQSCDYQLAKIKVSICFLMDSSWDPIVDITPNSSFLACPFIFFIACSGWVIFGYS